jgi:hypothetical protein
MSHTPTFQYAIGGGHQPVSPALPIWESPLPSSRHHFKKHHEKPSQQFLLSHGDYFLAVRTFLEENHFKTLTVALSQLLSEPISLKDINSIRITLMKHGEFYHPSQITVETTGAAVALVLNAAISPLGLETMDREFACLARLSHGESTPLVPRIFGKGAVPISGKQHITMFLGEWFSDYHEFHLSVDASGAQNICVWDENRSHFYLNEPETYALYHEATKILSIYYNLATYEQIFPWHHAAGDFVVKVTDRQLSIRMITVRQYAPIFIPDKLNQAALYEDDMMAGLLIYLLGLSIRMRLDRLDGIGEVAWADDPAVVGIWTGFLSGLASNKFLPPAIKNPLGNFESYMSQCNETQLHNLATTLINTFHPDAPEIPVILKHLEQHVAVLCDTISTIGFSL